MTAGISGRAQRRLAILAALAALLLFLGANAHLIMVAFRSQPGCAAILPDRAPARHAC